MFPACAGMNRIHAAQYPGVDRVPRMRGDEPRILVVFDEGSAVFPACAGMNRPPDVIDCRNTCVPRMRGDEPVGYLAPDDQQLCSPHARG